MTRELDLDSKILVGSKTNGVKGLLKSHLRIRVKDHLGSVDRKKTSKYMHSVEPLEVAYKGLLIKSKVNKFVISQSSFRKLF